MRAAETRRERNTAGLSVEPVFAREPHLRMDDGKLVAWFTEPPGAVVQVMAPTVFTKGMAEWVVGPAFKALNERFPYETQLRFVFDLRPMTAREPAARPVIMNAATASLLMFVQVAIIAPAKPPPLYMTTLHAAVALLSTIGPDIRVFETLEGALQHLQLTADPE